MTCPGACGGDPDKGGCGCHDDDSSWGSTQAEALAEGYPKGPRETQGHGSQRARRAAPAGSAR